MCTEVDLNFNGRLYIKPQSISLTTSSYLDTAAWYYGSKVPPLPLPSMKAKIVLQLLSWRKPTQLFAAALLAWSPPGDIFLAVCIREV
jgi:hypothetical protein